MSKNILLVVLWIFVVSISPALAKKKATSPVRKEAGQRKINSSGKKSVEGAKKHPSKKHTSNE